MDKEVQIKRALQNESGFHRMKAKMNIVSSFVKTKKWTGEDPNDRWVCDKNSYLLNWIKEQLRTKLPKFRCRIPDANGVINIFDFNQIKQRYENAASDLVRAKFDYIFKLKILEFYFGITISI